MPDSVPDIVLTQVLTLKKVYIYVLFYFIFIFYLFACICQGTNCKWDHNQIFPQFLTRENMQVLYIWVMKTKVWFSSFFSQNLFQDVGLVNLIY